MCLVTKDEFIRGCLQDDELYKILACDVMILPLKLLLLLQLVVVVSAAVVGAAAVVFSAAVVVNLT